MRARGDDANHDPQSSPIFYRPELDALRFFAFLAVFLHHAFPQDSAGWMRLGFGLRPADWLSGATRSGGYGVSLFFLLSSYLITELLQRENALTGAIAVRAFYIRRLLRIWPLYFFFLITVVVFARWIPNEVLTWKYLTADVVFLGNWAAAVAGYPQSVTAPLWSISIEEQFYVAWPILLSFVHTKRLALLAYALLAVALLTRLSLSLRGAQHPALWCNTLCQLDAIAIGSLLSLWLSGRTPRLRPTARVAGLVGCMAAIVVVGRFFRLDGWTANLAFPIVAWSAGGILVSMLGSRLIARRPLLYLGRISYGLYVFHALALRLTETHASFAPLIGRAAIAFALTVALASTTYYAVERPFLRLKRRFTVVRSRDAVA